MHSAKCNCEIVVQSSVLAQETKIAAISGVTMFPARARARRKGPFTVVFRGLSSGRFAPCEVGGPAFHSLIIMSAEKQKGLLAQANKILAQAGYRPDGRKKTERIGKSLRAISTPCGGLTLWRR